MLNITTTKNENTIDGLSYHFTRNNIDYTLLRNKDCVDVWKNNRQRRSLSNDCFWNGTNNQGRPMPKFMKQVMVLIEG